MKRAFTLLAAALLALLALPATPALALNGTPAGCAGKNGLTYDVRVCAVWGWRMQNDGTGVHVENVNLYTAKGCDDLESQAFSDVRAVSVETDQFRNIGAQYSCSVTWDLEMNGSDVGGAQFIIHAHVKVNNASDFDVDLWCYIYPNDPDVCSGQAYN